MELRSSSPSSFAAAGMSWRLGVDLGLDLDGEAGSDTEPADERVVRRGVTGCDISDGEGGGRHAARMSSEP